MAKQLPCISLSFEPQCPHLIKWFSSLEIFKFKKLTQVNVASRVLATQSLFIVLLSKRYTEGIDIFHIM